MSKIEHYIDILYGGDVNMDKRVMKTRRAIHSAMTRLLTLKPIEEITVTELADAAEINRKTFYNYYNNIYEVGAELQAEIEKELFAERREFNSTDDIEQYVDQIFAFLKQQESVYRQLLASDAPMAFMDQLESGMTQRVLSIMHEKEIDDRNVEFELLILASGTFAIVRKYYRNEVSVTLDDIRAYLSNKLRVLFEQYVK